MKSIISIIFLALTASSCSLLNSIRTVPVKTETQPTTVTRPKADSTTHKDHPTPDFVTTTNPPLTTSTETIDSVQTKQAVPTTTKPKTTTHHRRHTTTKTEQPVVSAEPIKVKAPRPEIVFKVAESTHVRLANYDPLEGKTQRTYSLDEIASEFHYPVEGSVISNYGMRNGSFHTGVDIKSEGGNPVYCVMPGVVRMAKNYGGYGITIVVRHYNGMESLYSHLAKSNVAVNQVLEAGDVVGTVGRTGRATCNHLHFEFRIKGDAFNPNLILDLVNCKVKSGNLYAFNSKGRVAVSNDPNFKVPDQLPIDSVDIKADVKSSDYAQQKNESVAAKTSTSKATTPKKTTSKRVTHKIVRGDTLYDLAKRYKTTVKAICQLNGITPKSKIKPGQVLRIK